MQRFIQSEQERHAGLKSRHPLFSPGAREDGIYKGLSRSFCLPADFAFENLFAGIRTQSIEYFKSKGIKWHEGINGHPSNHLCDTQVCCVNFLFPFIDKPRALKTLLSPVFPEIGCVIPIEDSGELISFEWIGMRNYLDEGFPAFGQRTRGANFTSADAAILFVRSDGLQQLVLVEWKYTESFQKQSLVHTAAGRNRREIYRTLFEADDCPIDRQLLPSYDSLFYEPFYRFFRQQLLANEMEKAGELGADIVSVLHIAPDANSALKRITPPELASLGKSPTEVWKKLVREQDRFVSVHTEELFESLLSQGIFGLDGWKRFIVQRYGWFR